jgi:hypothetical protein
MTRKIYYVTLQIIFDYDEQRTSEEDAIYYAKELAINPDIDSNIRGVSLKAVRIDEEFE